MGGTKGDYVKEALIRRLTNSGFVIPDSICRNCGLTDIKDDEEMYWFTPCSDCEIRFELSLSKRAQRIHSAWRRELLSLENEMRRRCLRSLGEK